MSNSTIAGNAVIPFHNRVEVYTSVDRVARLEEPMATMRAVQVSRPGGPFEMVERPIPEAGAGSVRVKGRACGTCPSEGLTQGGGRPGGQNAPGPGPRVDGGASAGGAAAR